MSGQSGAPVAPSTVSTLHFMARMLGLGQESIEIRPVARSRPPEFTAWNLRVELLADQVGGTFQNRHVASNDAHRRRPLRCSRSPPCRALAHITLPFTLVEESMQRPAWHERVVVDTPRPPGVPAPELDEDVAAIERLIISLGSPKFQGLTDILRQVSEKEVVERIGFDSIVGISRSESLFPSAL